MDGQGWHELVKELLSGTEKGRLRETKLQKRAVAFALTAGIPEKKSVLKESFANYLEESKRAGNLVQAQEYVALPKKKGAVKLSDGADKHPAKRQKVEKSASKPSKSQPADDKDHASTSTALDSGTSHKKIKKSKAALASTALDSGTSHKNVKKSKAGLDEAPATKAPMKVARDDTAQVTASKKPAKLTASDTEAPDKAASGKATVSKSPTSKSKSSKPASMAAAGSNPAPASSTPRKQKKLRKDSATGMPALDPSPMNSPAKPASQKAAVTASLLKASEQLASQLQGALASLAKSPKAKSPKPASDADAAERKGAKKKRKGAAAKAELDADEVAAAEAEADAAAAGDIAGADDEVERNWRADRARKDVKQGRFSVEEKAILKRAVQTYAAANGLDQENLEWLFSTASTGLKGKQKGPWQVIAQALPNRKMSAVWSCGTRMLHVNNYKGKWSADEDEQLMMVVEAEGPKWTDIGDLLQRLPESCRDRWKEIRHGDKRRSGKWDDEEIEKLRRTVEDYLAFKQDAERKGRQAVLSLDDIADDQEPEPEDEISHGRIVLDDVDWNIISDKVGTRSNNQCMEKWYHQLSPSMVSRGDWGSGDDRRMLKALLASGARQEFQVDWAELVQGRSAAACRRRWRLMLKCIPNRMERDDMRENLMYLIEAFAPKLSKSNDGPPGSPRSLGSAEPKEP